MDQLESEHIGWRECTRRCPCTSRRFRSYRSHHSRPRPARRSDGSSSDTSTSLSNRFRPLSTCGETFDFFNRNFEATAFSVNVNNFCLIDLVLCLKTQTILIRGTLLIQALYYFGITILYYTLPYFILQVKVESKYSNDIAMTYLGRHGDDLRMV